MNATLDTAITDAFCTTPPSRRRQPPARRPGVTHVGLSTVAHINDHLHFDRPNNAPALRPRGPHQSQWDAFNTPLDRWVSRHNYTQQQNRNSSRVAPFQVVHGLVHCRRSEINDLETL